MTSLFEKELMRMEQEVRDLKTFCYRGTGFTRFYAKELSIQATSLTTYGVRATTIEGEPSPAFTMIFVRLTPNGEIITGSTATENWRELFFASLTDGTFTVKAISTSNLTLERIQ